MKHTENELVCPKCKSNQIVPILYGEPSDEGMRKSKEGKIYLDGCIIEKNSPHNYCKKCKHKF